MKRDEFVLRVSDVAPELFGKDSQRKTCDECGRRFPVSNTGLWVYRFQIKGRTFWFCRYNCMRSGEKKLGPKAERKVFMKENKPTKAELEKDLKTDMTLALIAEKYVCSCATIGNWAKGYGLQGIRGAKREGDVAVDNTTKALQVHTGLDLSRIPDLCPDEQEPDDREPLLTDEEIDELESRPAPPLDPDPEPEQREPYEEVWSDLRDDIAALRRLHIQDADNLFFDRLHRLFLEVRG